MVWSQCGTRDLPDHYTASIVPALTLLFDYQDYRQDFVTSVLSRTRNLWQFLEPSMLRVLNDPLGFRYNVSNFQIAFRMNAPAMAMHPCSVNDQDLYRFLCNDASLNSVHELPLKPTLLNLRNVFTGPHNNALAWHTALAVCAPEDPTIIGSWIKMSETFSALRLDPSDQNAWQFWHLLRECVKEDTSGQELLSCLAETKHEMSSAFADAWSIVDALYENDARYACAARMHHEKNIDVLQLPVLGTEERMLQ